MRRTTTRLRPIHVAIALIASFLWRSGQITAAFQPTCATQFTNQQQRQRTRMAMEAHFPRILPPGRLGKSHPSLASFANAVYGDRLSASVNLSPARAGRKEYSLVVVTSSFTTTVTSTSTNRILLGLKHRGFGRGLYNSFGGKIDQNEDPAEGAVRELREEANIAVPHKTMERASVGTLHFTFDDPIDFEMLVHLYRVDLIDITQHDPTEDLSNRPFATATFDPSQIKGCDEISPEWFDIPQSIPLDNMFADDSIWMPLLLRAKNHVNFDGYFHFNAAVEHLSCLHHHLAIKKEGTHRVATSSDDCSNLYDEEDSGVECSIDTLWATAGQAAAANLPTVPSPSISAQGVVTAIFRGLQYNDVPNVNTGLIRCYEFMDLQCKKLVTGYGNVPEERTLEMFIHYAATSPKIRPFLGATSIDIGPVSTIPPTQTRGEIATCPIRVRASADPVLHDSGFVRDVPLVGRSTGNGAADGSRIPEQTFMIRLLKQRRPPLAGAYLVTDVIDIATVASISRPLNCE